MCFRVEQFTLGSPDGNIRIFEQMVNRIIGYAIRSVIGNFVNMIFLDSFLEKSIAEFLYVAR